MLYLTLLCFLSSCLLINGQVKLSAYSVDKSSITVSGISSGGSMAAQLHVAFSSLIQGSGIIAGPPYYCAQGLLMYATGGCMSGLGMVTPTSTMISKANSYSNLGQIDNTSNLRNKKVYIYSGSKDTVVVPKVVKDNEVFFNNYGAQLKTVYSVASVHGHITDSYGSACGTTDKAYINNCNYNQAYDLLNFLYPNDVTVKPSSTHVPTGQMILFDQKEFYPSGITTTALSMAASGYIYVPSQCSGQTIEPTEPTQPPQPQCGQPAAAPKAQCKLHIALHGCLQSSGNIGDVYVRNAGYNQVADLNNLIILYPQATANMLGGNPNACWDWWGYTNANYAIKTGAQMVAIRNMITRIASV